MAGVRQIVDGPGFTPLPNFLWDAAEHPSADAHWQQGVTWIERCGGGGTVYDECIAVTGSGGTPAAQASLSSNVTQQNRGATPFTVFAEFDCAPVGQGISQSDLVDRAEEALLRREPYVASRAFWTGSAGNAAGPSPQTTVWPHLAANAVLNDTSSILLQTAATQLVTGGEDVAVALGAVEAQLASCYGGQGAIHIPYAALPTFQARGLVQGDVGGPLYTTAGNRVVPGLGYDGSSPAGAAPAAGTSWIYGTGPLFAYRSDVFARPFPSTFDRSENTVRYLASRTYLIGFGCCHVAALTTLGVPT